MRILRKEVRQSYMAVFCVSWLSREGRQARCLQGGRVALRAILLFVGMSLVEMPCLAQEASKAEPGEQPGELFNRVISNQKRGEETLDVFERVQKVEIRKTGSDTAPSERKVWRLFPTGTGVDKIALASEAKPLGIEAQQAELEKLEKLEKYLSWIAEDGTAQEEAYAKFQRKRKERFELIQATHDAFIFKLEGHEMRGGRSLAKYSMVPNPKYKPTTRNTILFTKVRGFLWVDEESSELAKVEGIVTEDVSLALFLAKVYKGSHFMQERYEVAPGFWAPTFEQYDFDGRKYLIPFSIHERTFYSGYKRVGPPKEALQEVRAELSKAGASRSDP
jgi:hypothetical protein